MPDNQLLDASMQRALQKVLGEMPDVKPVTMSSSADGMLSRFLYPKNALATASPLTGNITYNPQQMMGRPQGEIENTIAHELTHSRQSQLMPWYKKLATIPEALGEAMGFDEKVPSQIGPNSPLNSSYAWRPRELEAFQTERDRTAKQHLPDIFSDPLTGARDVQLMSERKKGIDTSPSKKVIK